MSEVHLVFLFVFSLTLHRVAADTSSEGLGEAESDISDGSSGGSDGRGGAPAVKEPLPPLISHLEIETLESKRADSNSCCLAAA